MDDTDSRAKAELDALMASGGRAPAQVIDATPVEPPETRQLGRVRTAKRVAGAKKAPRVVEVDGTPPKGRAAPRTTLADLDRWLADYEDQLPKIRELVASKSPFALAQAASRILTLTRSLQELSAALGADVVAQRAPGVSAMLSRLQMGRL